MTSEEMLVKRAQKGDERAFAEIVKLYQNAVYSSALYIAKNEEDALDISQEVFLKLWRTLEGFRGEASLKTWIAKITRTCAIDYVRARNQKSASSLTSDEDEKAIEIIDTDTASNPQADYQRREDIAAVRKAVAGLPSPTKEIIIMREFHSLSYAEIAKLLGVPEGTVKSRISRGREELKEILKRGNFF